MYKTIFRYLYTCIYMHKTIFRYLYTLDTYIHEILMYIYNEHWDSGAAGPPVRM